MDIEHRLENLTLNSEQAMSHEAVIGGSQNSLHVLSEDGEYSSDDEFQMRPRSTTFPESSFKILSLPEIKVEDFSEELNVPVPENFSKNEGTFSVFSSPPRRRANTCPDDLFRRRRKVRPPTPPPMMSVDRKTAGKKKFKFPSKKLTQVAEDRPEVVENCSGTFDRKVNTSIQTRKSKQRRDLDFATKHSLSQVDSANVKRKTCPLPREISEAIERSKFASTKAKENQDLNISTENGAVPSIRRAHTIAESDLSHVHPWYRTISREVTS